MKSVEKLMGEIERLNMIIEDRSYSTNSKILASDCYFEIGDLLNINSGSVVESVEHMVKENVQLKLALTRVDSWLKGSSDYNASSLRAEIKEITKV